MPSPEQLPAWLIRFLAECSHDRSHWRQRIPRRPPWPVEGSFETAHRVALELGVLNHQRSRWLHLGGILPPQPPRAPPAHPVLPHRSQRREYTPDSTNRFHHASLPEIHGAS